MAQVLLDFVTGWDDDAPDELYETVHAEGLRRLHEVDAISVTQDDETGVVKVDIGPLLHTAAAMIYYLQRRLANVTGMSREEISMELREIYS